MRRYFCILVLLICFKNFNAQNVLSSANRINQLINQKDSSVWVFKELAKYVTSYRDIVLFDAKDSVLHSTFLKNYLGKIFVDYSKINESAKKSPFSIKDGWKKKLDSLKSGISTRTVFDATQFINTQKDSVIKKLFKIDKKQLNDSILKLGVDSVRKLKRVILNVSYKELFKTFSVEGKFNLSSNLNFEIQNVQNSLTKSLHIPSENDAIDALAIFIANRMKEETVMAFVEEVNKNIDRLKPLPCLFKNTVKELAGYSQGEPARFGSIIKKAIATDIAQMPDNIVSCNDCSSNAEFGKTKHFTNFINDISEGVDLITNIEYYAEKTHDTDSKFISALQLFRVVNRYYSFLEYEKPQSIWVGPDFINDNDSLLKLALSLVYEKEKDLFDQFLHKRYNMNDLDTFMNNKEIFKQFKVSFKELFHKLHRLDSYWQSNRIDSKSIVDINIYKEKVLDVFRTLYSVLNYSPSSFPTENPVYQNYLRAKEAVAAKDIDGIVYESQKLIDLLNCYQVRLPQMKLPHINFNWGMTSCVDTAMLNNVHFNQLKKDADVKISDLINVHSTLKNDLSMATISRAIMCRHWDSRNLNPESIKCRFGFKKFQAFRLDFEKYYQCGSYFDALSLRFNPWSIGRFGLFVFHHKEWKLSLKMWHIRLKYLQHVKPVNNENYLCYLSQENIRNKLSYNGARREVSQILGFFTDVTKAKNSEQLSKVLEEYAEPPRSYKIKRFNKFSVDVNAYPGVYLSLETKAGYNVIPTSVRDTLTSPSWGLTAPIGLSFSWGKRVQFTCENASRYPAFINNKGNLKSLKGGCFSATIIFFDIGAVVSYRLSHDASQALPKEVNFSQVLAPGFLLGYGLRGLPLVINLGCQYTPQLRTFSSFGDRPLDIYRLGISIAYDIPLKNLTNTTKRERRLSN